jgi:hypothetical protein
MLFLLSGRQTQKDSRLSTQSVPTWSLTITFDIDFLWRHAEVRGKQKSRPGEEKNRSDKCKVLTRLLGFRSLSDA